MGKKKKKEEGGGGGFKIVEGVKLQGVNAKHILVTREKSEVG